MLGRLEKLSEEGARTQLSTGELGSIGSRQYVEVEAWINAKAAVRLATAEERNLAISAEALSIAKDANRIASSALSAARSNARWAMYAAIAATIALANSIKEEIFSLIMRVL